MTSPPLSKLTPTERRLGGEIEHIQKTGRHANGEPLVTLNPETVALCLAGIGAPVGIRLSMMARREITS